jgi:tetratricopeptide (TPR) repeat protein
MSTQQQSKKPKKPKKPLLIALIATVALAGITLPWQLQQWKKAKELRLEAEKNQAYLAELQAKKAKEQIAHAQLQQNPQDSPSQAEYIRSLFQQGRNQEAIPYLNILEEKEANNPDYFGALSDFYNEIAYIDLAVHYAKKAVQSAPNDTTNIVRLGFLEIKVGWDELAKEHMQKAITLSPNQPEPYQGMALFHQSHLHHKEALVALQKADSLRPEDHHIQIALSRAYRLTENLPQAIATLKAIEKRLPNDSEVPMLVADALFLQATKQTDSPTEQTKILEEAEAEAQKSLQLAPNDNSPYQVLASIYDARHEPERAIAAWDKLYTSKQINKNDLYKYGRLLLQSGDKENKAKGRQLIAQFQEGNKDDDAYNRLIIIAGKNPNQASTHRELAKFCEQKQRIPRGILEWEEVLRLLPNDTEAKEHLKALRTERGDIQ